MTSRQKIIGIAIAVIIAIGLLYFFVIKDNKDDDGGGGGGFFSGLGESDPCKKLNCIPPKVCRSITIQGEEPKYICVAKPSSLACVKPLTEPLEGVASRKLLCGSVEYSNITHYCEDPCTSPNRIGNILT